VTATSHYHTAKIRTSHSCEAEHYKAVIMTTQKKPMTSFVAVIAAALLSSDADVFVHASSSTRTAAAFGLGRREALRQASATAVGGLAFLGSTVPAFANDENEAPFLAEKATEEVAPTVVALPSVDLSSTSASEEPEPTLESVTVRFMLT